MKTTIKARSFFAALCLLALAQGAFLSSCERPENNVPSSIVTGARPVMQNIAGQTIYDTIASSIGVKDYQYDVATGLGSIHTNKAGLDAIQFKRVVVNADLVRFFFYGGSLNRAIRFDLLDKPKSSSLTFFEGTDLTSVTAATSGGKVAYDSDSTYLNFNFPDIAMDPNAFLGAICIIHELSQARYNRGPVPAGGVFQVAAPDDADTTNKIPRPGVVDAYTLILNNGMSQDDMNTRLWRAATRHCSAFSSVVVVDQVTTWPLRGGGWGGCITYACYEAARHTWLY